MRAKHRKTGWGAGIALAAAALLGGPTATRAQEDNPLLTPPPVPAPTPPPAPSYGKRGFRGGTPVTPPQPTQPKPAPSQSTDSTPAAIPDTTSSDTPAPDALPSTQLKALVLIEGDYSVGSGFIAKLHDQYFIVTNQHVLSGNTKFTITGMDGTKFPTNGPLYGSMDYDVAILKIPDALAQNYLEVETDAQANTKPADAVTVPGNSEGNGVPVQINGKLIGVGPELVEVDAKFVHGNSGSPIIDRTTGKVIGIATLVKKIKADTLSKAANMEELHWFGYRLDNIKQNRWSQLDWKRFSDEGVKVGKVDELLDVMVALLEGDSKLPHINNSEVQDAIDAFISERAAAKAHNNAPEYVGAITGFINRLQAILDGTMKPLASNRLYPYHAQKLKEDQEIANALDKAFLDIGKVGGQVLNTIN